MEKVLHHVMEEAIGDRGVTPAAICLGIAGVDRPDDFAAVRGIMRRIGYKARVLIVNDALVALEAGAPGAPGVVIISGTGSIAYGRNRTNEAARAGGWGYVLGDEGSGYWIGRAALRAVLRESDHRGQKTALTPLLLKHFGIAQAQGLLHEVYYSNLRPSAIGSLAQCVEAAFREGDSAAIGILRAAANELEASGLTVARRLGLVGEPFTFVLSGGIFRAVPWLREELERRLPVAAPGSITELLAREPAAGAVALAHQGSRGRNRCPCLQTRLMSEIVKARLHVYPDDGAAARALARHVADAIRVKPDLVLGLPTGTYAGWFLPRAECAGGARALRRSTA